MMEMNMFSKLVLKFSSVANFGNIPLNMGLLYDQGRITLFMLLFKFSLLILELNVRYPGAKVSLRLLIQKGCQNMGEYLCFIFLFVLSLIQFVKVLVGKADHCGELAISHHGWS